MARSASYDIRYLPTKEYVWFLNDPCDGEMLFFKPKDERDTYARETIEANYTDGEEWVDEIVEVFTGKVESICVPLNEFHEEDGYDYGLLGV